MCSGQRQLAFHKERLKLTSPLNVGAAAAKKTLSLQNFLQDENQVESWIKVVYFLKLLLKIVHIFIFLMSTCSRMAPTVKMGTTWRLTWQRLELAQTILMNFSAQLNLDEEELIVMESCHSYIHDMLRCFISPNWIWRQFDQSNIFWFLRHLGPTHATDPILLHEINKFPDEAKVGF